MAFLQQAAERQRFGRRPVDALAGLDRLAAIVEEALDRLVDVESFRDRGDHLRRCPSASSIVDAGVAAARIVERRRRPSARPSGRRTSRPCSACSSVPASNSASRRARQSAFVLSTSPSVMTPSPISFLRIDIERRRMRADLLVHQRLGEARLVAFVVAEAAIAAHVDDDRLWNFWRNSIASLAANTTASGSSPLTWKIGAWIILATSDG